MIKDQDLADTFDKSIDIRILGGANRSTFYVHVLGTDNEYKDLEAEIQNYFEEEDSWVNCSNTIVPFSCFAFEERTGTFHRVNCLSMIDGVYLARMVDRGYVSIFHPSGLYEMPESFMQLPARAVHCSWLQEMICTPGECDLGDDHPENIVEQIGFHTQIEITRKLKDGRYLLSSMTFPTGVYYKSDPTESEVTSTTG